MYTPLNYDAIFEFDLCPFPIYFCNGIYSDRIESLALFYHYVLQQHIIIVHVGGG